MISERRVVRFMQGLGLQARKKRRYVRTTDSAHNHRISERKFKAEGALPETPDRVWAGDITYIQLGLSWHCCLAVVMDLYNREIKGWALESTLGTELVLKALRKAINSTESVKGIIFHSDRGCQYASKPYRDSLKKHGFEQSMGRVGNCYDNCYVESFFKTLKTEMCGGIGIQFTDENAHYECFKFIESWYNPKRRHSSLGYLSPREYLEKQ